MDTHYPIAQSFSFCRRYAGRVWLFILAVGLLNVVIFFSFTTRLVAEEVYFGNRLVGGLNEEEARQVVRDELDSYGQKQVVLQVHDGQEDFSLQELGILFDEDETISALFHAGRHSRRNVGKAQMLGVGAGVERTVVLPQMSVDQLAMKALVAEKLVRREIRARNAELGWAPGLGWEVRGPVFGKRLLDGEVERIVSSIIKGVLDPSRVATYTASYEAVAPERLENSVVPLLPLLQSREKEWVEVSMGRVRERIDIPGEAPEWFALDYAAQSVKVNVRKVAEWVSGFAERYDIVPSTITLKGYDEKPSDYRKGVSYKKAVIDGEMRSGRKVNQEKMVLDLVAVLEQNGKRKVVAESELAPMTIVSEIPGLSFLDLISVGESDFSSGNQKNRVHNILNALKLQDGTVVLAGEETSFNTVGGWVDYSTGYVDGQVITGDSLSNLPGGGVCQVSTTMFRAIVNAGLRLTQRKSHSWDVHYYQDWYGIDAAIFPPGGLDLAFVNDSPGPILIHAWADKENERAYFEFYGTKDGRSAKVALQDVIRLGGRSKKVVNEWVVTHADGHVEEREIVSNFKK